MSKIVKMLKSFVYRTVYFAFPIIVAVYAWMSWDLLSDYFDYWRYVDSPHYMTTVVLAAGSISGVLAVIGTIGYYWWFFGGDEEE